MATASGHGLDVEVDRIARPSDLDAWLEMAGWDGRAGGAGSRELASARSLRDSLFAIVPRVVRGQPAPEAPIALLNEFARAAIPPPQLDPDGGGTVPIDTAAGLDAAFAAIARDAIDLLTGEERELLRECAAADCTGVYVDRSRGRRRRWCSTRRCGNRARVAAHRERLST